MIIVLTNRSDVHADELIRLAKKQDFEVFRINSEDILSEYTFSLGVSKSGAVSGYIEDQVGRRLDLKDRHVAWYRKPSHEFKLRGIEELYFPLVRAEAKACLDVLYCWPNIHWVNCPFKSHRAKSKLQQLIYAGKSGISTPDTLVSNVPSDFSLFCANQDWDLITKAIYTGNVDGINATIPTTQLTQHIVEDRLESVRLCPTKVQSNIRKNYEVRVTVIGDAIFAASIDSQSHEETRIDWRPESELCEHAEIELPQNVKDFCLSFLKEFDLEYGAFDFAVDSTEDYVFFECNPFGQYLWVEYETGQKITQSVLNHLASHLY